MTKDPQLTLSFTEQTGPCTESDRVFRVDPVVCAGCNRSTHFDFSRRIRWHKFLSRSSYTNKEKFGYVCSPECYVAYRSKIVRPKIPKRPDGVPLKPFAKLDVDDIF